MTQLGKRLAGLSADRRQLLELMARGSRPAVPPQNATTLSPQKAECRRQYDEINQQLDASDYGALSLFLNLGYVGDPSESQSAVKLPEYCLNKNSVQLVLELIGACDLKNREVLDVGCGRGGAISLMKQYFKPRRICGIDIAPAAIGFCRSSQPSPGISFEVGDAEQLPFADGSFDVVTNMESSSTYPDIFAFYRGVFRVLRRGGYFLYTDALPSERFSECSTYLRRAGFDLELDRDITANVLASCDEIAQQRLTAYGPAADQSMNDFLGAPGSHFYNEMKRGAWTYRIQRWKKPSIATDDNAQ